MRKPKRLIGRKRKLKTERTLSSQKLSGDRFPAEIVREKKNEKYYLILMLAYTVVSGLCSEGYIQAYLTKSGVPSAGIGVYGSAYNAAALITYALCVGIAPKKPGFRGKYLVSVLLMTALPALLLVSVFRPAVALPVAIAGGVIYSAAVAYRSTSEQAMLPYLFEREKAGTVTGNAGFIGGLIAIVVTTASSGLINRLGFPHGYSIIFTISIVFCAVTFCAGSLFRLSSEDRKQTQQKIRYREIFQKIFTRKYLHLLLPHFYRGLATAGMYFFMSISLRNTNLNEGQITLSMAVSVAAAAIGNLSFVFLQRRINSGTITLAANIICSVMLLLTAVNRLPALFFIIYFVYTMFNSISQVAIPFGVLGSTENDDLPMISAMRMLIMSGTSAIFIFLFGWLLNYISPIWIMAAAAFFFVLCGFQFKGLFTDALLKVKSPYKKKK